MKQKIFNLFSILGIILGLFSSVEGNQVKDPVTGVSFPSEVSFSDGSKNYTLELTGIATRQKFFVKVYSIAHYLQDPGKEGIDSILNDTTRAKQLTMHWVRGLPVEKLREAYHEGIQKTLSPEEFQSLHNEIESFLNLFKKGASAGDIYVLRWLPKGKLTLDVNGERIGEVVNTTFAKAVWGIWFGPHSVVKKDNLVTRINNHQ